MKNKKLLIGVGIVILLVIIVRMHATPPQPQVVDDSNVTLSLDITEDHLPEGMSLSDISITEHEQGDNVTSFDLEPSGLTFNTPVPFVFTLPVTPGSAIAPLIIHESENELAFIENFETTPSSDGAHVMVSGTIDHFSRLTIMHQLLKVTPTGAGSKVAVGSHIHAGFTVAPTTKDDWLTLFTRNFGRFGMKVFPDSTYSITRITLSPNGPITPSETTTVAGPSDHRAGDAYTHPPTSFLCTEAGSSYIWIGPITFEYTITGEYRSDRDNDYHDGDISVQSHASAHIPYECVGENDEGQHVQIDQPSFNAPMTQPPIGGHR